MVATRAGNSLIGFPSESLVFCQKWANERFAQKNEQFTHLLIYGERPEGFAHNCSFPLSDVSESLIVAHFWWATGAILSHCSSLVSNLSDSLTLLTTKKGMSNSLTVAHFLWATWAIPSWSLICLDNLNESLTVAHLSWQSEQIAYCTVAHLIWAKWANEQMSKWANEQIPSPGSNQCRFSKLVMLATIADSLNLFW